MMNHTGRIASMVLVVALGLLAACGGGGDDTGSAGNPPPPAPNPPSGPPPDPPTSSQPTLTLSPAALHVTAMTSDTAPTRTITLSVANLTGAEAVFASGDYSGSAIDAAWLDWQGNAGTVTVRFMDPAVLGPGIHTSSLMLRACRESPCVTQLNGSPTSIPVTYQVTAARTAVTLNGTSVTVTGDNITWHAPIEDRTVGLVVAHPTSTLWARTRVAGEGAVVTHAHVDWPDWPSRAQGVLELTFRPPSTLGAGTYTDSVEVDLCLDDPCTRQAIGSPLTIPVTYEVTGSTSPTITVHWSNGRISGADLVTAETRSPKMVLTLIPTSPVHGGVYARHTGSATGLITSVVETQVARGSQTDASHGKYEISLAAPATLGSGVFTDSMEFEACFDPACTVPVSNSRHTVSVRVVIMSTEGVDFVRHTIPETGGASDVAWSQANQRLYVSSSVGAAHRVLQVDPATRIVTPGPLLGTENLNHLAVTDDGAYLYAGSRTRPFVHRLALSTLQVDLSVSLGTFSASTPYLVSDLATLPGQPQSFVVAVGRGANHGGIYVYDNAVARPDSVGLNPAQAFESARWLIPALGADTFLSQSYGPSFPQVNTMDVLTVDASGISTISSAPTGHEFYYSEPLRVGTQLFTRNGWILDAGTGAMLGTLPGVGASEAHAALTDEARGRLYFWTEHDQRSVILVYDAITLQRLAIIPVYAGPDVNGRLNKSMTLWGDDGLALVDGEQLMLLSGPVFAN